MSRLKTPTPYFGGKFNKVGAWIASVLPPHRFYVEPCGGMAGVLFQKKPSFAEVYNDIDHRLVNLFEVLRNKEQHQELHRLLELTPYSREEWRRCKDKVKAKAGVEPMELARCTYVVLAMGYAGSLGDKSFSWGGTKYESSVARTYINGLESLPAIHRRVRNLLIDCQDAIQVCQKWDSPETVLYLDPPYLKDTRKSYYDYTHEMKPNAHSELLAFVRQCQSKVLISGYLHPLYTETLEPAFQRIDIPTHSPVALSNGHDAKRTECVWMNYDLNPDHIGLFAELNIKEVPA